MFSGVTSKTDIFMFGVTQKHTFPGITRCRRILHLESLNFFILIFLHAQLRGSSKNKLAVSGKSDVCLHLGHFTENLGNWLTNGALCWLFTGFTTKVSFTTKISVLGWVDNRTTRAAFGCRPFMDYRLLHNIHDEYTLEDLNFIGFFLSDHPLISSEYQFSIKRRESSPHICHRLPN
jgi:hypothetical protein